MYHGDEGIMERNGRTKKSILAVMDVGGRVNDRQVIV